MVSFRRRVRRDEVVENGLFRLHLALVHGPLPAEEDRPVEENHLVKPQAHPPRVLLQPLLQLVLPVPSLFLEHVLLHPLRLFTVVRPEHDLPVNARRQVVGKLVELLLHRLSPAFGVLGEGFFDRRVGTATLNGQQHLLVKRLLAVLLLRLGVVPRKRAAPVFKLAEQQESPLAVLLKELASEELLLSLPKPRVDDVLWRNINSFGPLDQPLVLLLEPPDSHACQLPWVSRLLQPLLDLLRLHVLKLGALLASLLEQLQQPLPLHPLRLPPLLTLRQYVTRPLHLLLLLGPLGGRLH